MEWSEIKKVFDEQVDLTHPTQDGIINSLGYLEREMGDHWIRATKESISNSTALGRMVVFSRTNVVITPEIAESVRSAVDSLRVGAHRQEHEIPGKAFLVFDPSVGEARVPASDRPAGFGYAFPVLDPDYRAVKLHLGIDSPMTMEAALEHVVDSEGQFRARSITRIHRPVMDPRAFGKVEQEYEQLPSTIPGVVVVDMSRTSMALRPIDWIRDVTASFVPELRRRLSAVWLRSGHPFAGSDWTDILVCNLFAEIGLPAGLMSRIVPYAPAIQS